MPWPSLPAVLMTDRVTVVSNTWGEDGDGGRSVTASSLTYNVPAAVQPGEPDRLASTGEDGLNRVTTYTPFTIDFQGDVALKTDDVVLWTDPRTRATHTITVTTYTNLGGGCNTWQAKGEERT